MGVLKANHPEPDLAFKIRQRRDESDSLKSDEELGKFEPDVIIKRHAT